MDQDRLITILYICYTQRKERIQSLWISIGSGDQDYSICIPTARNSYTEAKRTKMKMFSNGYSSTTFEKMNMESNDVDGNNKIFKYWMGVVSNLSEEEKYELYRRMKETLAEHSASPHDGKDICSYVK